MKADPVSSLLAAAEALRATARGLECIELADADNRADLRALIGEIRYRAFLAISLAAVELRPAPPVASAESSGSRPRPRVTS